MKRKSWMLGVLFVLIALVSYMAKPEKEQNDLFFLSSTYKCNFLGADNKQ